MINMDSDDFKQTIESLLQSCGDTKFKTILADPPWQFKNRTGKVAPEHKRLNRYPTMTLDDIKNLPVSEISDEKSHLYLWVPNALLPEGLEVLKAWGFEYKTNLVWEKIRRDGEPDGRGVGFYYRNVTELLLFGTRGKNNRTLDPGRSQVNLIKAMKREHSRKPDEVFPLIEACSPGPYLEMFARGYRKGWVLWGNQANDDYIPNWNTYSNHSLSLQNSCDLESVTTTQTLDLYLCDILPKPSKKEKRKKLQNSNECSDD